jgi:hypothetical protein
MSAVSFGALAAALFIPKQCNWQFYSATRLNNTENNEENPIWPVLLFRPVEGNHRQAALPDLMIVQLENGTDNLTYIYLYDI